MMQITFHGSTQTGPVREANEDMILVGHSLLNAGETELTAGEADEAMVRRGLLAVVADGMGGHAAGERAAHLALETLKAEFYETEKKGNLWTLVSTLNTAAALANQAVADAGTSRPEWAGMGCTLAGVALMGREYVVFHAGDSRVYRYRHDALRQLTEDDTLVALAIRSGRMSPQEAETSTIRHYVTNAAGVASFELHVSAPQSLRHRDVLMVSSDGLHGMADLETMEKLLGADGTVGERAAALAGEAVSRGGHDNISVILIAADDPEAPEADG